MKILYFANGERGTKCLEALLSSIHKVACVVGEPQRVNRWDSVSLKGLALARGIQYLEPNEINNKEFIAKAASFRTDIFILSGYAKLLKKELLSVPPKGVINLHGGKLPQYRGGSPINWQIIKGETELGLSILYADASLDSGDIILQRSYRLGPDENATAAYRRSLELFPPMLIEALDKIEQGNFIPVKQDQKLAHTYPKRRPEDGRILWDKYSAQEIVNLARALTPPYPRAFAFYKGEKITAGGASCAAGLKKTRPGEVISKTESGAIVATLDGAVLLSGCSLEIGARLE